MSNTVFENFHDGAIDIASSISSSPSSQGRAPAADANKTVTRKRTTKGSRVDLLQEAKALEELGAEWLPAHAAAFCVVSESFLRRSACPKLIKRGAGRTDKPMITYLPTDVRRWNAARTRERMG